MILVMMFVGCTDPDPKADPTFDVTTVTTAPVLDGVGGDAAWGHAHIKKFLEASGQVDQVRVWPNPNQGEGVVSKLMTKVRDWSVRVEKIKQDTEPGRVSERELTWSEWMAEWSEMIMRELGSDEAGALSTSPRSAVISYLEDPLWDDWPLGVPKPGLDDDSDDPEELWVSFLETGEESETFEEYKNRLK